MPIVVENKLKARARAKGLKGKHYKAYVYGTLNKLGLLEERHPHLVALAQKIDLGEDPASSGLCSPCESPSPKRYFPRFYISGRKEPIKIPNSGKAMIEYQTTGRSMNQNDGQDERYSIDIEVHSIEPMEEEKKPKEGEGAVKLLESKVQWSPPKESDRDDEGIQRPITDLVSELRKLTGFAADPRPRNSLGEYASPSADGPGPDAMAAAYGPPTVQPVSPMRESHLDRIKRFFGKRRAAAEGQDASETNQAAA